MLVDWFTVGAQALNFVVLVWLMKRFLYGPILRAVETRDALVAAELADAREQKGEASAARDELRRENERLDRDRESLMQAARDDAEAEGRRLLDAARDAAEAARVKQERALAAAAEGLREAVAERAQREVFAIARKALSDLSSSSLEERLAAVFNRRLRELEAPAKAELRAALVSGPGPALVRSAFELSEPQRAAIKDALDEAFSMDVAVAFEAAPELVSGIELTANGRKVAWSIAEYLGSLAEGVQELVASELEAEPAPPAAGSVDPAEAALSRGR